MNLLFGSVPWITLYIASDQRISIEVEIGNGDGGSFNAIVLAVRGGCADRKEVPLAHFLTTHRKREHASNAN